MDIINIINDLRNGNVTFGGISALINNILGILFILCYAYQFFYIIVPWFWKEKPHKETVPHKIGVFIAARNEESVIQCLIDSIQKQTYDLSLVTIFVVADNCTDQTAEVCRRMGAKVYERFDTERIGKGYALEFLYENIKKEYGEDYFDAFLVLDADNLLEKNYIEEMNKTFSDGYQVLTSYRNSKNYDDNWISAGYSLWFLRESKYLNNSRMLLNTTCAVSGTGFMFDAEIMKESGGWNFFLLTEDIEFTMYNVTRGRKVGYAKDAHLYDEQPTKFSQSWRQRLRWSRGFIQVCGKYTGKLISRLWRSFSCYDMFMTILPALVISILTVVNTVVGLVAGIVMKTNVEIILRSFLVPVIGAYITCFVIGIITFITEYKNIKCKGPKKFFYCFTFPIFMMTYIPIAFVALFKKVKWTPIKHDKVKSISEVESNESAKANESVNVFVSSDDNTQN